MIMKNVEVRDKNVVMVKTVIIMERLSGNEK